MSSTPPTEILSVEQKRHEQRAILQSEFVISGAWQTCVSCDSWHGEGDSGKVMCQRYRVIPPPEVLVVGCRDWDMIPF